ncbi:MAG: hypothetical protein H6924_12520 [Alphaproteobacteria bacterium]|nr:hypothetical protein [Alphaproteobacteria bacterium]
MPTLIRLPKDAPPGENVDFSSLFDSLPEPLAYIGPDRKLDACNRRFRELFPALIEERLLQCLPSPAGTAIAPTTAPNAADAVGNPGPQLVSDGKTLQPRARPLANGGMLVSFENMEPPPELAQARCSIDDLRTRLCDAQIALDAALLKADSRKNALIATSHELRTPLNAILGFAEMMEKETFGPLGHERYRDYVAVIRESGSYLLGLINDLLDLAKLDAGKSHLHLDRVQVLRVIVDCVKTMEPLASKSHVGMSVHVYDGVSLVVGDDMRLHQMLLNLLSNAVKFSREGSEISIDVFRRGRFVGISVSDSGTGMSADDIARVMEPFEQACGGACGGARGTGLGLPLTRELAELHGGELRMESVAGEGTTITILLPVDGPEAKLGGPVLEGQMLDDQVLVEKVS